MNIQDRIKETEHRLVIMKAYQEGKTIQVRHNRTDGFKPPWIDVTPHPEKNPMAFDVFDYRIKPEPRDFWAVKSSGASSEYFGLLFTSEDRAQGEPYSRNEIIHVREVL